MPLGSLLNYWVIVNLAVIGWLIVKPYLGVCPCITNLKVKLGGHEKENFGHEKVLFFLLET